MFSEIFQRQENEVKECGLKTVNEVASNFLAGVGPEFLATPLIWTFPKFSDYVYLLRYYDLFDFTLVRWTKSINCNFSRNRYNHENFTLNAVPAQFLGCTAKNFWTRVLGSVVIQRYAGERMSRVDRALLAAFKPLEMYKIMGAKPGETRPPNFFVPPNFCMTQSQSSVIKFSSFIFSTTWSQW